jgi:hypothetical protein
MPLTDVIVSEGVAVHAERFVPGGELETRDTPEVAARSGRLLADLVRRLATLDLDPPLPNREWVRWDATPEREPAVAVPAWIEDATRRVQAKLAGCDPPPVLGHADWEAQGSFIPSRVPCGSASAAVSQNRLSKNRSGRPRG